MGIEELRSTLEQEGRARVAALLREAEAEATRLRAEAEREAARRRAERLAREEESLRREARARVDAARTDSRRRALAAREELLARVFERAEHELSRVLDAPDAHTRAWLLARAREALAHLPEGPVRVAASTGVAPVLAEGLGGREDLRVESDPELPAGFRAHSADGVIVVDATVPTLVERARASEAIEVLRQLDAEATSRGDDAA